MIHIFLKDIFAAHPDAAQAGYALANTAKAALDKHEIINFDMEGELGVSTVFLNASLGYLMDHYGVDRVRKSFRFSNILKSQASRITKYFDDYEKIYFPETSN